MFEVRGPKPWFNWLLTSCDESSIDILPTAGLKRPVEYYLQDSTALNVKKARAKSPQADRYQKSSLENHTHAESTNSSTRQSDIVDTDEERKRIEYDTIMTLLCQRLVQDIPPLHRVHQSLAPPSDGLESWVMMHELS